MRPVLRYHGGKYRLAPRLIKIFPPHRVYTEAFGGGASVLMQKPRSYAEIYNDLDGEVVNVFRVLQNRRKARNLEQLLRLTPFARKEFLLGYKRGQTDVERARRTIIRSFMGFGSDSISRMKASRAGFNTRLSSTIAQASGGMQIAAAPLRLVIGHIIPRRSLLLWSACRASRSSSAMRLTSSRRWTGKMPCTTWIRRTR